MSFSKISFIVPTVQPDRAAPRPHRADSVSGTRGGGSGEKLPPAVASVELLFQLGLPWQQLCIWKPRHRKGMQVGHFIPTVILSFIHTGKKSIAHAALTHGVSASSISLWTNFISLSAVILLYVTNIGVKLHLFKFSKQEMDKLEQNFTDVLSPMSLNILSIL